MDPFLLGMLGTGALGGLGGFLSGQKQAEKASDRYHMSRDLLFNQLGTTKAAYSQAQNLLQGNLAGIGRGFGQARADLSRSGGRARTSIMDNQARGLGAINTGLAQKGLGSTTILQNAQRGLYSDTSRQLAEVDEALGSQMSGLRLGEMNAKLGATSALAGLGIDKANAIGAGRNDLISLWLGSIPQAQNPAAGIGALGGSAAQYALLSKYLGG